MRDDQRSRESAHERQMARLRERADAAKARDEAAERRLRQRAAQREKRFKDIESKLKQRHERESLRERKKERTREAIAMTAMKLFAARGFDEVTVAEIARAADVAEQTVYNYFPTKEQLVLGGDDDDWNAAIIEEIRSLPPGASVVEPFRRHSLEFIDHIESEPADATIAMYRVIVGSSSLVDRLMHGWENEATALADALADWTGTSPEDPSNRVVAHTLLWTFRMVFRAGVGRLIAGADMDEVVEQMRQDSERTYDLIEFGLGDFGKK